MTDTPPPPYLDPDSPEAREVRVAVDADQADADAILAGHDVERHVPWTPSNHQAAEWAMALAARSNTAIAEQDRLTEAWIRQLRANNADATRAHRRRLVFLEGALRRFALAWHEEDPKVNRTLHLPSGSVATRTPAKPTVRVREGAEAQVLAWLGTLDPQAVAQAEAVKFSDPEVRISGVRKLVNVVDKDGGHLAVDPTSGEVVPGLVVDPPGETTATVKPYDP